MIAKTYISVNLNSLDVLYRGSSSVRNGLFYSKLAIIEICGWIEMSMDNIIERCSNRNLRDAANKNFILNDTIRRNYGFDYDQNFRRMLIQVIGLKHVERIEHRVNAIKFQRFKAALAALKGSRNSVAHTYLKGTAIALDAPSVTKARFTDIYDGLIEFERVIAALEL